MAAENNLSGRIDSLEIRRNKGIYIYPAAIFGLAMFVNFADKKRRDETIGIIYPHFSWTSLLFVVTILSITIYLCFCLADNSLKLKISEEGIWTKRYDLIPWKDIWYVSGMQARQGLRSTSSSLIIKLKGGQDPDDGKELKVSLSGLNIDIIKMWKVLDDYCAKNDVKCLGL